MSGGLLNMILCYCVMLIDSVIYMYWITYGVRSFIHLLRSGFNISIMFFSLDSSKSLFESLH